jgi:hypothetical protein
MTPTTHNENENSPVWGSTSSGGERTPANEEVNENALFFPTGLTATDGNETEAETFYETGVEDKGWEEDNTAIMTMTEGTETIVGADYGALTLETVFGDDEGEEEEENLMGERHLFGHEKCRVPMTGGRICGHLAGRCPSKGHNEKVALGLMEQIGWCFLDPKTYPKQRATGRIHGILKSHQTQAMRDQKRALTRGEIEKVSKAMGEMGLAKAVVKQAIAIDQLKTAGSKVKNEASNLMDPMLDVPEDDAPLGTLKKEEPKENIEEEVDEGLTAGQTKAESKKEVKAWLDQKATVPISTTSMAKSKEGISKVHVGSKGPTQQYDVHQMSIDTMVQLLEDEKAARMASEKRLLQMMTEAREQSKVQAGITAKGMKVEDTGVYNERHHQPNPNGPSSQKGYMGKKKVKVTLSGNSDSEASVTSAESKGNRYRCKSKESGYARRNPSRATWKTTSKWYVVLAGKQVGIYRDWNRARKYVEGYSNAFYRAFKDFGEAKAFYRNMREEEDSGFENESDSESSNSEGGQPAVVTPNKAEKPKGNKKKKVHIQEPDSGYDTAADGSGRSEQGGNSGPQERNQGFSNPVGNVERVGLAEVVSTSHAGADRSTKSNEVHDVNMANEAAAYRLLAPPGAGTEVERSLLNGAIDVSSLPGKGINDYNTADTALQEISTTLSESLRGEEFQVRGRIAEDHRWKNANKDYFKSLKTLEDVREGQELMHEIEEETVANMENGWRAVLYEHMGWSDETVELWLRIGVLPNLIRNSLLHYKALLFEVEYMCNGSRLSRQAEVFLQHHARKLGLIRTHRARTRLQLIWMTYTYLRDARSEKFVSQNLQLKQTDALRVEMEDMRNHQNQSTRNTTRTPRSGNPGGSGYNGGGSSSGTGIDPGPSNHNSGGNQPLQCGGCKSKKIHPDIGRRGCPFKDFPDPLARKMGKTAEELIGAGKSKAQAINEAIQKHQNDE